MLASAFLIGKYEFYGIYFNGSRMDFTSALGMKYGMI